MELNFEIAVTVLP